MTKATKPTETTEVAVLAVSHEEYGIEKSKALELTGDLPQKLKERAELVPQYNEILKMDIEAPETAKKATELRKLIKNNRTKGIEVWHSNAKNYFLRGGQFVDAIRRAEVAVNLGMEEALESIEKYAENKAKEAHEAKTQNRIAEVAKYATIDRIEFEFMGEDSFNAFISGLKADFERREEEDRKAREEAEEQERINKLHSERKQEALPYYSFWTEEERLMNFGEVSETDFKTFMERLKKDKAKSDLERIELEREAEKLRAQAAERQRKEEEKAKLRAAREVELRPYIVFIRDYNKLIDKEEADYKKELSEIKKVAELEWEYQRKQEAKVAKELTEARELKARLEAEEKERQAELDRKAEEEREMARKAEAAPTKEKLSAWINKVTITEPPIENELTKDIMTKFENFKNWAKAKIDNHE